MLWGKNKDGRVKVWELPRIEKTDDKYKDDYRSYWWYKNDFNHAEHEKTVTAETLIEAVASGELALITWEGSDYFSFEDYWRYNKAGFKVAAIRKNDLSALKKMYTNSMEVQDA